MLKFIKDIFVMAICDILNHWSNELLISKSYQLIKYSGQEHYSYHFFFEPNINVKLSPLTSCITHDRPKQFASAVCDEFQRSKLESGYEKKRA